MGLGGIVVLLLFALLAGVIVHTEKRPFHKKSPFDPASGDLPKFQVNLVPAPQDMTERMTPLWQRDFTQQLKDQGYHFMGDHSYASLTFFWARVFISPDKKSALLLVNWAEGKELGKILITNLEIYSFSGNSFILTACAQDGAMKLLTGANRPTEEQLSLHLKAVYAASAAQPIIDEHQRRLAEWESKGEKVRELTSANVLASLSKVFS